MITETTADTPQKQKNGTADDADLRREPTCANFLICVHRRNLRFNSISFLLCSLFPRWSNIFQDQVCPAKFGLIGGSQSRRGPEPAPAPTFSRAHRTITACRCFSRRSGSRSISARTFSSAGCPHAL